MLRSGERVPGYRFLSNDATVGAARRLASKRVTSLASVPVLARVSEVRPWASHARAGGGWSAAVAADEPVALPHSVSYPVPKQGLAPVVSLLVVTRTTFLCWLHRQRLLTLSLQILPLY